MINSAPLLAQEYLQDAETVRQQSCSFGLFGLSGFFWLHETNQIDRTDLIARQTGLVQVCHNSFPQPAKKEEARRSGPRLRLASAVVD
jgi:hypothetical protein